jgi:hypothetical protein
LAHGKKLLAKKLSQYGAVAIAAALAKGTASARVPPTLLHATAKAALQVLAGQVLKAGLISTQVITLAEGVMKAMLLNKLKVFGAVVLAICVSTAAGLGYRAVAQEPGQGRSAPRAARLVADELEELRLEIAALRKGLQNTRDRVQALEGELQTLKARAMTPAGDSGSSSIGGGGGSGSIAFPGGVGSDKQKHSEDYRAREIRLRDLSADTQIQFYPDAELLKRPESGAQDKAEKANKAASAKNRQTTWKQRTLKAEAAADPLAQAETALTKLRANPSDKQAADVLERALQQFKERYKEKNSPQDDYDRELRRRGYRSQ